MEELRLYSTIAGELVRLVQNETPELFVEHKQYMELSQSYSELKAEYDKLMEKEYSRAHWEQFYDNR